MSVSGITSGSDIYIPSAQSNYGQRIQDFENVDNDLQSDDLSSAQSAFLALAQDLQGIEQTGTGQAGQDNLLSTDFSSLGSALQSGDLSGAQKAFATLQQDIQNIQQIHHHHHSHQTSGNDANTSLGDSASESAPGYGASNSYGSTFQLTA